MKTRPKRLKRCELDQAKVAPALAQIMAIGEGAPPLSVSGWFDSGRRIRKISADYPNGWRLTARINTKGEITSSSASLKMALKPAT